MDNKTNSILNVSTSSNEQEQCNPSESSISSINCVGKCWSSDIANAFDTLILERKERPFDWYKDILVSIDKADASRIRRGLVIPPLWLRIKIAAHFNVDTSVIWKGGQA